VSTRDFIGKVFVGRACSFQGPDGRGAGESVTGATNTLGTPATTRRGEDSFQGHGAAGDWNVPLNEYHPFTPSLGF
jgi:hypothetical protein